MPLFDWLSVQNRADGVPIRTVSISGMTVTLLVDALAVMLDRWRWDKVTDLEWDEIEAAISEAYNEILLTPAGTEFIEEFDRADGVLGNGWAADGDFFDFGWNTLEIFDEDAIPPVSGAGSAWYETDQFGPDVEIIASATLYAVNRWGVMFRMIDQQTADVSGYLVRFTDGWDGIELLRVDDNATFTVVDSASVSFTDGDGFRVTAIGANIVVYAIVGGIEGEVINYTDLSPMDRAGYIGIYCADWGVGIERIEVRNL